MLKLTVLFLLSMVLGLLFHLFIMGDTLFKYQNISISLNVYDVLLAALLCANLLLVMVVLRRK